MRTVLALAICLLSISCSNRLKEGKVIDKIYEPESETIVMMPMYVGEVMVFIPYIIYDGEDYIIKVKGTHDGQQITETFYVTKYAYECVSKGSHFVVDKTCSTEDQNNTQKEQHP